MEVFSPLWALQVLAAAVGVVMAVHALRWVINTNWRPVFGLPPNIFTEQELPVSSAQQIETFNTLVIIDGRPMMNEPELLIVPTASTARWYARVANRLNYNPSLRRRLVSMVAIARRAMNRLGAPVFGATCPGQRSMALAS